jgi:iron complex outermembrane recepter protein
MNGKFTLDGRLSKIQSDGYIDRASSDLKSFFLAGSYYSSGTILTVKAFSGKEITYQAWDGVPSDSLPKPTAPTTALDDIPISTGRNSFTTMKPTITSRTTIQILFSREFSRELYLNAALHYTRGYGYYEQYKDNHRFSNYGLDDPEIGGETITRTDLVRRKFLDNHFYGATWSLNYKPNRFDIVLGGAVNRYLGDHYGNIIWAQYAAEIPKDYPWYLNLGEKTDLNSYLN